MAEKLIISGDSKAEKYEVLYKQIKELVGYETDEIANMANISSMIHETFGFLWTGFYRVVGEELVLGPFQGPLACSSLSRSEIVVPVLSDGVIVAVLDIDSRELSTFDEEDRFWLEKIVSLLGRQ